MYICGCLHVCWCELSKGCMNVYALCVCMVVGSVSVRVFWGRGSMHAWESALKTISTARWKTLFSLGKNCNEVKKIELKFGKQETIFLIILTFLPTPHVPSHPFDFLRNICQNVFICFSFFVLFFVFVYLLLFCFSFFKIFSLDCLC